MKLCRFSIITLSYNNFDDFIITYNSVVNQLNADDQYIIVDACSTGKLSRFLKRVNDSRVKILYQNPEGVYSALNCGLSYAENDIVSIIHSGDFFLTNTLSIVKSEFKNCDILFGSLWKEHFTKKYYYINNVNVPTKIHEMKLNHVHPSVFVHSSVYRETKFNSTYKISSDLEFFLKCFKKKCKFKKINFPLTVMSSGGISTNKLISSFEGLVIRLQFMSFSHSFCPFILQLIKYITRRY